MTTPRRHHRYTYADYVALEHFSAEKHEFFDGEIYAMAGGSEDHSALAAEMVRVLGRVVVPSLEAELDVDEIYRNSEIS